MKDHVELIECDDCGAIKPIGDFQNPGHTSGGQVNGFDIDSNVCTECGQRGYDKLQADLCEAAVAEMAAEENAPRLRVWIPGLPIALVKGRKGNYLVNYELRTCGCDHHKKENGSVPSFVVFSPLRWSVSSCCLLNETPGIMPSRPKSKISLPVASPVPSRSRDELLLI